MTVETTHRCCVYGCPNLAVYEVRLYSFDPNDGAMTLERDDTCPFICLEHAAENERNAASDRRPWLAVQYPYTNRERAPGIAVYMQLERALAHVA